MESRKPLPRVLAVLEAVVYSGRHLQSLVEWQLKTSDCGLFHTADRKRGILQDAAGNVLRLLHDLTRGDDMIYEPQFQRLFGIDETHLSAVSRAPCRWALYG